MPQLASVKIAIRSVEIEHCHSNFAFKAAFKVTFFPEKFERRILRLGLLLGSVYDRQSESWW